MEKPAATKPEGHFVRVVDTVLESVPQEREKEIIARRFGLYDRKETLEQIGEMLGITRERVRQLEKAILVKLRLAVAEGKLPVVDATEKTIVAALTEKGRAAKISNLAKWLTEEKSATAFDQAHLAFLAELMQNLTIINENDNYHQAVAIGNVGTEKEVRQKIEDIVKYIKQYGQPLTAEDIYQKMDHEHPRNVEALASISKKLAQLKGNWGLAKWPTVNPKNIRDKIFVILEDSKKPMHFSDIAKAIKASRFKRHDVTTQAVHNELIKDKRFVLIGRGIYALSSWGYSQGTVADIITSILKKSDAPLHRDEIVKQVLASRQVKETTILLNLQSKPQFKRVAKATYALEEQA